MNEKEIVVITGAAAGIGKSLAQKYHGLGAKVIALDCDVSILNQKYYRSFVLDVSDESAVHQIAQKILTEVGKPTIWINNAGIAELGEFREISSSRFDEVIKINFNGVVYGTRAAISIMKDPVRGKIVNIASMSGIVPVPFLSSYVASKYAVVGFTRALREEFMQLQLPLEFILVTPGFVDTKIMDSKNGFGFPDWLKFLVDIPKNVAEEIYQGVLNGKSEITPTFNGKMLRISHRMFPNFTIKSTRLLSARNWKQLLGVEAIDKS